MNCCNHACNQGRTCPVRQACELPDHSPAESDMTVGIFFLLALWFLALVLWRVL
jgi:hypothetical protein